MRWVLLFVVVAVAAYAASLHRSSPGEGWPADIEQARAAATASGRPLLIQFTSAGCHYCAKMDREVLPDPGIVRALANFELAQVDAWRETELADRYGVQAIPAFVVLGPGGQLVGKVEGYVPAEAFRDFLQRTAQATWENGG